MIKPAYSVSFLLSINIFVWQNVLYFLDAPHTKKLLRMDRYGPKHVELTNKNLISATTLCISLDCIYIEETVS